MDMYSATHHAVIGLTQIDANCNDRTTCLAMLYHTGQRRGYLLFRGNGVGNDALDKGLDSGNKLCRQGVSMHAR